MRFCKFTHLLQLAVMLVFIGSINGYMSDVWASNATPITAEASHNRYFARLTFKWPKPVYLTAETDGNELIIHFERAAKPNIESAVNALGSIISSYDVSNDGKTLTFILKGDYRVRSFVSGNKNGVDISPLSGEDIRVAKAEPQKSKQQQRLEEILAKPVNTLSDIEPAAAASPEAEEEPEHKTEKGAAKKEEKELTPEEIEAARIAEENKPSIDPMKINRLMDAVERNKEAELKAIEVEKLKEKARQEAIAAKKEAAANKKPMPKPAAQMSDAEAVQSINENKKKEAAALEASVQQSSTSKMSDADALQKLNDQSEKVRELLAKQSPDITSATTTNKTTAPSTQQTPINGAALVSTPAPTTTPTPVAQTPLAQTPAPPNSSTTVATPESTPAVEIKPEPIEAVKEADKNVEIALPSTNVSALQTPEPETTPEKAQSTPEQVKTPEATAENAGEKTPDGAAESVATSESAALPDTSTLEEPTPNTPIPDAEADDNSLRELRIRASLKDEILTMTFPWQKRTAVAAFVRDELAWIVFSTKVKLNISEVSNLLRTGTSITEIKSDDATVFYMPVPIGSGITVENVAGTFKWVIKITPSRQSSKHPLNITFNTDPELQPHILLPLLEASSVIQVKDPVVGDIMDILPIYSESVGISPTRKFIEFALLETSQGLVVQRISDSTTVTPVRNGIRISTEFGATITPNLPPIEEVKKQESMEGTETTLFPNEEWQPKNKVDFMVEIKRLEHEIVTGNAPSGITNHLRIAELYLAQGWAVEALGYLNNIKRLDPNAYIDNKLSALHGVASFLMQRYSDAAQDFSTPELKNIPEADFWRVMLSELLGNPTRQFDYQENYEPYIKFYPSILKQRLGIIAADRAIAAKDYNGALKIFDQLNEQKLISEVADYINYMMGKIALETQEAEAGYKLWQELMNGKASEFVKVRAEFSLIAELMRRNNLEPEEAINRLERLAIRWRGDNLELAVLAALGNIYKERKDWPNAIRVWRSLNEAFPNTVEAVEASRSMNDAFVAIFDKGESGGISGLELMFLYNEYRDLIPTDDTGDRIVDNLTAQMIQLDMMDQAEKLLEQRMLYRFEHETRSKVGSKLARVYMLDKKPEKALEALQLSVFGVLPEALLKERTYIAAEALLALKRYNDLFTLLSEEKGQQANAYKMQAYWQSKDWEKMVEFGEAILKERASPTAELTALETDVLLKLALGYVALGDNQQLTYLRDYFGKMMEKKPSAKTFEFLTRSYEKLNTQNFDEVVEQLDRTKSYLEMLSEEADKAKLEATKKPTEPAAVETKQSTETQPTEGQPAENQAVQNN